MFCVLRSVLRKELSPAVIFATTVFICLAIFAPFSSLTLLDDGRIQKANQVAHLSIGTYGGVDLYFVFTENFLTGHSFFSYTGRNQDALRPFSFLVDLRQSGIVVHFLLAINPVQQVLWHLHRWWLFGYFTCANGGTGGCGSGNGALAEEALDFRACNCNNGRVSGIGSGVDTGKPVAA